MIGMLIFSMIASEDTLNRYMPVIGPILLLMLFVAYGAFLRDRKKHPERYIVPDVAITPLNEFQKTGNPAALLRGFDKSHLLQTAEQLEELKSPEQKAFELKRNKTFRYSLIGLMILVSVIAFLFVGVIILQTAS